MRNHVFPLKVPIGLPLAVTRAPVHANYIFFRVFLVRAASCYVRQT